MGKIFKGALLGAVSALGAYYYKNPKELEKHKELLKENTKNGIEKLTAIINEKTQELEAQVQEEKDVAKEKLEELTASEEVEKAEENFVELGAKAEEVKEAVVAEATEKAEEVKEATVPVVEKVQEVVEPVVEKVEEAVSPAVESTFESTSNVVEEAKEVARNIKVLEGSSGYIQQINASIIDVKQNINVLETKTLQDKINAIQDKLSDVNLNFIAPFIDSKKKILKKLQTHENYNK